MKTIKEISGMFPLNYRVYDFALMKGRVKMWSDRIQIVLIGGETRTVSRRFAYKYGLCGAAD